MEIEYCIAHNVDKPTPKSLERLQRRLRGVDKYSAGDAVCIRCSFGMGPLDNVIRRPKRGQSAAFRDMVRSGLIAMVFPRAAGGDVDNAVQAVAEGSVFDHFHADRFGVLPCLLPLLWSTDDSMLVSDIASV